MGMDDWWVCVYHHVYVVQAEAARLRAEKEAAKARRQAELEAEARRQAEREAEVHGAA
jgi:hypothetical protein